MEFTFSTLKTQNYTIPPHTCSYSYVTSTKQPLVHWAPQNNKKKGTIKMCTKKTSYLAVELKKELAEIKNEWRDIEKCQNETLVDLLECLEKEAIMGDDEGREPNDYNRRAQIFDKSSKVFQALKQLHATATTTTDITSTNEDFEV